MVNIYWAGRFYYRHYTPGKNINLSTLRNRQVYTARQNSCHPHELITACNSAGIAIQSLHLFKDRYNKEPPKYLLVCFLLGVVSAAAAALIEISDRSTFDDYIDSQLPAFLSLIAGRLCCRCLYRRDLQICCPRIICSKPALRQTVRRHCLQRYGGYGLYDY